MERQQKAYKGVIDYFKKKIMDGELRPGEKLPPERDIAERLNVSRNSVREAIRIMDMTGVISSQQGSGNYITCEFQKSLAETMTMMSFLSSFFISSMCAVSGRTFGLLQPTIATAPRRTPDLTTSTSGFVVPVMSTWLFVTPSSSFLMASTE